MMLNYFKKKNNHIRIEKTLNFIFKSQQFGILSNVLLYDLEKILW